MNNITVLEKYPKSNYVLLKRESKYEPYVAAWAPVYDDEGNVTSWCQGHYFSDLASAGHHIFMIENGFENEVEYMIDRRIREDLRQNCYEYTDVEKDLSDAEIKSITRLIMNADFVWEQFDINSLDILKNYLHAKKKSEEL